MTVTAGALLLYRNEARTISPTASQEETAYPASKLATHLLSDKWRTAGGLSGITLTVDLGATVAISAVTLLATNLTTAATRRVEMDNTSSSFAALVDDSGTGSAFDTTYTPLETVTAAGGRHVIYVPSAAVSARYVRVTLTDAANPGSYLEASVLGCWLGWQPALNFVDWRRTPIWYGAAGARQELRTHELTWPALTAAEENQVLGLARHVRDAGRMVLVPLATTEASWLGDAVFARLARPPEASPVAGHGGGRRMMSLSFVEVDE